MLRSARELEYGFSVLDKKNPNTMFKPSDKDVFVIPPEEETRMPAQEAAAGLKLSAEAMPVKLANLEAEIRSKKVMAGVEGYQGELDKEIKELEEKNEMII